MCTDWNRVKRIRSVPEKKEKIDEAGLQGNTLVLLWGLFLSAMVLIQLDKQKICFWISFVFYYLLV